MFRGRLKCRTQAWRLMPRRVVRAPSFSPRERRGRPMAAALALPRIRLQTFPLVHLSALTAGDTPSWSEVRPRFAMRCALRRLRPPTPIPSETRALETITRKLSDSIFRFTLNPSTADALKPGGAAQTAAVKSASSPLGVCHRPLKQSTQ